jgi:hypothetical protein
VQTLALVLDLSSCIHPLILHFSGKFCSSSYLLLLEPSDVIPNLLIYCIRFLLFPNKEVRSMFCGSISCMLMKSCIVLNES